MAALDFEPSGLSTFIGPNNAGKSALLSALDMVGGLLVPGPLRFAGTAANPEIQAVFTFDETERRRLAETIEAVHREEAAAATEGAVYTLSDVRDNLDRLGLIRIAVLRSDGHQWPVAELTPQGGGGAAARTVDWGTWLGAWPNKPELPQGTQISGSPMARYLEGEHGPNTLPSMLLAWRRGFYHFRSPRLGAADRVTSTENHDYLQPTGANLGNYLQWLRGNREQHWQRIRETMTALVPDVGTLQIRAELNRAEVGFEAPGLGFVNIKDAGTGVEQLLLTIAVGQTTAANMLIVEEPETNLHPGAQRQLMKHLVDWSHHRPVLIATHSPIVMDAGLPGRLYEVSRSDITSSVRQLQGQTDIAELLTRIGTRFSDILGSDRVLVVEGPSDGPILEAWFSELTTRSEVALVPGGGGAGVWHMGLMEQVSAAADRLPRPVLYLRDRDELSNRNLARLEKLPAVRVLRRRELENYLLHPAAIAAVLAARRPAAAAPNSEDVAAAIRKAADDLRSRVIVSRVVENAECLSRLDMVTSDERKALFRAEDPVTELATVATAKLSGRLEFLEACVREAFDKETAWVAEHWPEEWELLVPGADVLSAVFEHVGGYSKDIDGPEIARAMGGPPEEIANIIGPFLARGANHDK
jgi:predicted ATPase